MQTVNKDPEKSILAAHVLQATYGQSQRNRGALFEGPTICTNCRVEFVFVTHTDVNGRRTCVCQHCGVTFAEPRVA